MRFIAYEKDFYVFPAELLHEYAIKELEIEIDDPKDINISFQGISKIANTKLIFHDSNQNLSESDFKRSVEL